MTGLELLKNQIEALNTTEFLVLVMSKVAMTLKLTKSICY